MYHKIFMAGYRNFLSDQFRKIVDDLDAIIVDVRYNPYSYDPFWHIDMLSKEYNNKYIHIRKLGNKTYKEKGKIEIVDLDEGCRIVTSLLINKNVILLCACEDINVCHRKVIAKALEDMLDIKPQEIQIEETPNVNTTEKESTEKEDYLE